MKVPCYKECPHCGSRVQEEGYEKHLKSQHSQDAEQRKAQAVQVRRTKKADSADLREEKGREDNMENANWLGVPCPCGGETENCCMCDGYGRIRGRDDPVRLASASPAAPGGLAGFAADPRGGSYGVRENGRFGAGPEYDNFDD